MKLIEGINVLVGEEGPRPITRESYLLATQIEIPVKTFIYNGVNKDKNLNDAFDLAGQYNLYNQEFELNKEVTKTTSIFVNRGTKYDVETQLQMIVKICSSKLAEDSDTYQVNSKIKQKTLSMSDFVKRKYSKKNNKQKR